MARVPVRLLREESRPTTSDVQQWARRPKHDQPRRPAGVTKKQWTAAFAGAAERRVSGEWEGARPLEFVALYALLHRRVYGLFPEELSSHDEHDDVVAVQGKALLGAAAMAKKMLEQTFDGDAVGMASYVKWVWDREK